MNAINSPNFISVMQEIRLNRARFHSHSDSTQFAKTKSAVVRAAPTQYIGANGSAPPESFAFLAREFIGSAKGGPSDLSFNKKHMEAFGRE
jgi:hypothetical protein